LCSSFSLPSSSAAAEAFFFLCISSPSTPSAAHTKARTRPAIVVFAFFGAEGLLAGKERRGLSSLWESSTPFAAKRKRKEVPSSQPSQLSGHHWRRRVVSPLDVPSSRGPANRSYCVRTSKEWFGDRGECVRERRARLKEHIGSAQARARRRPHVLLWHSLPRERR
jgi:hypothetical protein